MSEITISGSMTVATFRESVKKEFNITLRFPDSVDENATLASLGDSSLTIEFSNDETPAPLRFGVELRRFQDVCGKYGFKDAATGNVVIEALYDEIRPFSDYAAKVQTGGKYGIIDPAGNVVLEIKYGKIGKLGHYSEGLARVRLDATHSTQAKYGFVDVNGKVVLPIKYDHISDFDSEGKVAWIKLDGEYGLIDTSGNVLTSPRYDRHEGFYHELAEVKSDGKWGFINTEGYEVIDCIYDRVSNFYQGRWIQDTDGKCVGIYATVTRNGEEYYICTEGRRIHGSWA